MAITTTICLYAARSVSFIAETPDTDLLPLNDYVIRIALPVAISS